MEGRCGMNENVNGPATPGFSDDSLDGLLSAAYEKKPRQIELLPGSTVLTLSRNYRSHQEVLDLANWLLERSALDYRKRLVAERGLAGERPVLLTFEAPPNEGAWLARDLVRRHDQHDAGWRDHLILLRTAYSGRLPSGSTRSARPRIRGNDESPSDRPRLTDFYADSTIFAAARRSPRPDSPAPLRTASRGSRKSSR